MELICGMAAITLLVAVLIVIRQANKSGKIFDCIEASNTEQQWVHRAKQPGKFRSIIACYVFIFSIAILFLGWVALGGQAS